MLFAACRAPDGLVVVEKEHGVLPEPRGRQRTLWATAGGLEAPPLGRLQHAEPNCLPRPPTEPSLAAFSDPTGFEDQSRCLELSGGLARLGFWLGLRRNPGELPASAGAVLARASVLRICCSLPPGSSLEGEPVFHPIRTLEGWGVGGWGGLGRCCSNYLSVSTGAL